MHTNIKRTIQSFFKNQINFTCTSVLDNKAEVLGEGSTSLILWKRNPKQSYNLLGPLKLIGLERCSSAWKCAVGISDKAIRPGNKASVLCLIMLAL